MSEKITCSGCTKQWTGVNRAHCAVCHSLFGGVTSFTAHRTAAGGKCIDPELLGLKLNESGVYVGTYGKEN